MELYILWIKKESEVVEAESEVELQEERKAAGDKRLASWRDKNNVVRHDKVDFGDIKVQKSNQTCM